MAKKPPVSTVDGVAAAISVINSQFGTGAIRRLGDTSVVKVPVISTGLISLDKAIGPGGLPRGRTVEIYGPESSGKTTLSLQILAQAQKYGPCAYIDAEHALDPHYASVLGVDVDELLLTQPDNGEQALEIANILIKAGGTACIVIDSVAALTPKAEIEGEIGDSHMGLQARMMGQALRMLTSKASKTQTTLIFINQIREKIGVLYGSPETVPGGRALKFFASLRLDVRRRDPIKEDKDQVGALTEIKIVKNKVGRPFVSTKIPMYFGMGFSAIDDLLNTAVELEAIQHNGSFYYFQGEPLGNGLKNAKAYLTEHPETSSDALSMCREILWGDAPPEFAAMQDQAEDLPETIQDLPDEDLDLPEDTESVMATATYEQTDAPTIDPSDPDNEGIPDPIAQAEFAIRDWFCSNPGKMVSTRAVANALGYDHDSVVEPACRKLAQSGILDDAGYPDGGMFAYAG